VRASRHITEKLALPEQRTIDPIEACEKVLAAMPNPQRRQQIDLTIFETIRRGGPMKLDKRANIVRRALNMLRG